MKALAIMLMAKGDYGRSNAQKRNPRELQLSGVSCLFIGGPGRLGWMLRYVSSPSNHLHR